MNHAIAPLVSLMLLAPVAMAQADVSGYVDVGDSKIFYEAAGQGPVLILIHDGLVHREIWDEQFPVLAKDYRVVRYDRRGYGKSSAASGVYSNVEDLNRLYAELEIREACLIGMSSGGALAIDFTLQYPDKVSSLILVGAVVGGFSYTRHFFDRGGYLPSDLETEEARAAYYAREDPYEIFRENKAATQRVARLVKENPRKGRGTRSIPSSAQPAYRRLGEIEAPALVLVGEFDMPDVHAHAGAINAGIAHSTRDIIPKSGHLIPIEQPELFNAAVGKFLKQAIQQSPPPRD